MHITEEKILKLICDESNIPKDLCVFRKFNNIKDGKHMYIWFAFGLNFNRHPILTKDFLATFPLKIRKILKKNNITVKECDWYWDYDCSYSNEFSHIFRSHKFEFIRLIIGKTGDCTCEVCSDHLLEEMMQEEYG